MVYRSIVSQRRSRQTAADVAVSVWNLYNPPWKHKAFFSAPNLDSLLSPEQKRSIDTMCVEY